MATQKGPVQVCMIPVPHFRLRSFCHMLPGGRPTPATPSPSAGGGQPSEKPRRNKERTCTSEDVLEWAVGEGIGEFLSLTGSAASAQPGEIRCSLRGSWFSMIILKDQCLGRTTKEADGTYQRKPGFHAQKAAAAAAAAAALLLGLSPCSGRWHSGGRHAPGGLLHGGLGNSGVLCER